MKFRSPNTKEEKLKLKVSGLLEADRIRLLMEQPFVGAFLIRQNLIPVVDCRCDTAITDGQNIFVNSQFYLDFTPRERRFLLAHEVWHSVYCHFLRRGDRDHELFNIASDMEINAMLRDQGFKVPDSACLPPEQCNGLNAEALYDYLLKSAEELPHLNFDQHVEPGDDINSLPDSGNGSQSADGNDAQSADGSDEDIPVCDPDFKIDFGEHPEEKIREKVIEAAVQHEKMRGVLPAGIAQIVEGFRSGKLHWKELLAQFVTSCFGGSRRWLPPNRRYISSGLYLQSRRDSQLKAILAVDTSGSTHDDLPRFAAELSNLLNSFGRYELKVICCDAAIQSVETFTHDVPFDAKKFNFQGGGGTAFTPVFDYVKEEPEQPDVLIYLTDGFGDEPPKPTYPVLWVITKDGENHISWGQETVLD